MRFLGLKYDTHAFAAGFCPRPCWGSLQNSPNSLAGCEKRRDGRGREGRRKG